MTRVKPGERKRAKAPKVRTGCRTCKLRKVKCDEARPACTKCISTGRICDGFDHRPDMRSPELAHRPSGTSRPGRRTSTDAQAAMSMTMSASLSSYRMSSSFRDPLEARSLLFFTERTLGQFQAFFPDDFWNSHVLQFALSQDCIRHALVSLSAHHELFMQPGGGPGPAGPAISSGTTATVDAQRAFALKQHNLAIQSLLACGDPSQALHVHLVSCLIFICIEAVQGEIRSAIRLFKHGLSMIEELQRRGTIAAPASSTSTAATTPAASAGASTTSTASTLLATSTTPLSSRIPEPLPPPTTPSFSESIVTAVVAFLNRFAVQVSILAGDIDPELGIGVIAGHNSLPTLSSTTRFHSLFEARESILNLAIHVLSGSAPGAYFGDGFLESAVLMLGWWTSAFDRMVEERGPHLSKRGVALLELHKRFLAAQLKVPNPSNNDERWDAYVGDFAELVTWAERALQPDSEVGGLPAQFHMDLGVIPVMFSTVLRCRDAGVRRRALAVLRNHRLQEGVWDSSLTLRAAERVVMLEGRSMRLSAAGTQTQPQRVKSVVLHMDPDAKAARLQYGLEDHTFEEVLDW